MKRLHILFTFSIALALSACNPISPAIKIPEGKIVSCQDVKTTNNPNSDLVLDCMDGDSQIDLADIAGPAVVNFWGSWCGPCREEIPYFVDLANSLPKGLTLIGVDREETSRAAAEKFIRDLGINYPQLSDQAGASKKIVGMNVPVTIFIDESGKIVFTHVGAIKSADELRELILEHLGV